MATITFDTLSYSKKLKAEKRPGWNQGWNHQVGRWYAGGTGRHCGHAG